MAGTSLEYGLLTDDPVTPEVDDPTVEPVGCGLEEPPDPGALGPEMFPAVIPQHAVGAVIIAGDDLGTDVGAPMLTINGLIVKTETLPPLEQTQVVTAHLVPGMTEEAGVIPFTLTPANPEDPEVPGLVEVHPAAETAQEIVEDYGRTVSSQIDYHLGVGLEAFRAASAHALLDPASCEAIKDELISDLLFENDQGALQIAGSERMAFLQAVAANASGPQLDDISNARDDGVRLLEDMMLELVNKVDGNPNNVKKPGKGQILICPE